MITDIIILMGSAKGRPSLGRATISLLVGVAITAVLATLASVLLAPIEGIVPTLVVSFIGSAAGFVVGVPAALGISVFISVLVSTRR